MESGKSQFQYFLIVVLLLICLVSIYKIIYSPSEKYWILTTVLSASILIFIFSVFGTPSGSKQILSISDIQPANTLKIKVDTGQEELPDAIDEGWDLPL